MVENLTKQADVKSVCETCPLQVSFTLLITLLFMLLIHCVIYQGKVGKYTKEHMKTHF